MSLEKILKRITDDAQAEADKIILENRRKAKEIKENARKEASKLAEELVKEAERKARLEASRLVTQARLEKKINILSEQKDLIEEVLGKAFQKSIKSAKGLKRKIILKKGEREEPYDEERLKEELRSKLENEIMEALKI
jgi:V/A-type H+-transporting ATPase subunit E